MKIKILSFAVALMALASCTQMNEQKYNDTVVNMYNQYATQIDSKMAIVGNATDKQKSLAEVKSIEKTTDSCIAVMNGLKPSDAAKDFHEKVLAMFQTVKSDFVPLAQKMASIDGEKDVEGYNKLIAEYNDLTTKVNQTLSAAQAAQQVYGSKVGMKVQ